MRIAICEDVAADAKRLRGLLNKYLEVNSLCAEVDQFTSGEELLAVFAPGKYQIVFQDIYMRRDGMTGMQVAENIRQTDRDAAIILTTTSLEYGIASYKVNAAYYIVKPVGDADLADAMEKCGEQIERFAKTITITENRQPVTIRLRDIHYVEAQQRTSVFMTAAGEIRTYLSIDEVAGQLGGFPFHRCHRSFIVNLIHIADMPDKDFVLQNGGKVPISKAFYPASLKAFKEYFRAKMQGKPL